MTTTSITAIRDLLTGDLDRVAHADAEVEHTTFAIDVADAVGDGGEVERLTRTLRSARATAIAARQSFAARTELLQHVDLGDVTVDDLIRRPGGRVLSPDESAPAGLPSPGLTKAINTTAETSAADATPEVTALPRRYRKLPVEVDAMLWHGGDASAEAVTAWCAADGTEVTHVATGEDHPLRRADEYADGAVIADAPEFLVIPTLEGDRRADVNDVIIQGIRREFYPNKPDIFARTHMTVDRLDTDASDLSTTPERNWLHD
jgi:hypothetical protein